MCPNWVPTHGNFLLLLLDQEQRKAQGSELQAELWNTLHGVCDQQRKSAFGLRGDLLCQTIGSRKYNCFLGRSALIAVPYHGCSVPYCAPVARQSLANGEPIVERTLSAQ